MLGSTFKRLEIRCFADEDIFFHVFSSKLNCPCINLKFSLFTIDLKERENINEIIMRGK